MQPEIKLLLCCARVVMDTSHVERAQTLLRQALDWPSLLQSALQHGMMPLLYRNLQALPTATVPPAVVEQLRATFHAHAGRALFLTGELLKILAVLEAHQIPVLPFKGPVLAAAVYGSPILRQFGDLDILVHKHDVLKVRELLVAQCYCPYVSMTAAQEAAHLRSRYHVNVLREESQVMVEIHWAFARRYWGFALDMAHVQEHCTSVSLTGTLVRTLAPEDLLLVLAVHGAKHYWSRLGWICDVAEVLRGHQALDWGRVMAHANALGVRRILGLGLLLAQQLCGATLPGEVEHQIHRDARVGMLAAQIIHRLCAPVKLPLHDHVRRRFYLHLRERRRERVRYLVHQLGQSWRHVYTPTAVDRALLPSPLVFLCLFLRPLRLACKYGWRIPQDLLHLLWHSIRGQ